MNEMLARLNDGWEAEAHAGMITEPELGSISPARILSNVDLPAPLGPISP